MGIMSSIGDALTGGLGSTLATGAMEIIKNRFPAKLSEAEGKALEIELIALNNNQMAQLAKLANDQTEEFNTRIKEMEGTAKDLKGIPILGPIVLFMRGVQRPVWGFGTLYLDYKWFAGEWVLDEQQASAATIINLLVLGFLFGERAIKNLEPLLMKIFAK
jgi:hypothetical protein